MKEFIKKYRYDITIFLVLILAVGFVYFEKDRFEFFSDREAFIAMVNSFGAWGPLLIIGTMILEVVVAPIPGFVPAITAGFVFGPILGSVYTYAGNLIGTALVFYIARKFGKRIVERFLKKERLMKYEKTIAKHENFLLIFFFIPILPIDVIAAAFGLSKIKAKKFFTYVCLGYVLYSVALTNFGDYLAEVWF